MWDWNHYKEMGWIAHTTRAAQLSGLLILSGLAMLLHMLLPFWQQPEWLRCKAVACSLCPAEAIAEPQPEEKAQPAPKKPRPKRRRPRGI
tara:strand:- start:645 stop:914 length:270 start_codon:yes stop_codon:yes gene_type:complete